MAVTTQNSTEHANTVAVPAVNNGPTELLGRVRVAAFTCTQSGAGDATSSFALFKLPAGKIRVLLAQSWAYVNWTTAAATLDLGWDAYTGQDGVAVAADPNGLIDGLDVETAGMFQLVSNIAALLLTGGNHVFESQDGVVIRATSQDVAIVDLDDLVGSILYVHD